MKILAFAASNSRRSINRQLVACATGMLAEQAGEDAEVEIIDLNDYEMPIYSIDRENEAGVPPHGPAGIVPWRPLPGSRHLLRAG